ncbi:MAG: mechanosensitive ion channel family protein [Thermotogota bacterium]|nr:mechanosensitive ion channel family protein [Thermotogota bacterium]
MNFDWMVVIKIVISIGIFVTAIVLAKLVFKIIQKTYKQKEKELSSPNTLKLLLNISFITLAVLIILSVLFNNLIPALTGLGIGGIVLGFALQRPLENAISGIFLLIGRNLKEGDVVKIGNTIGVVEIVSINHTYVNTFDGKKILIPNTLVWSNPITHYWPTSIRRMEISVGIPYEIEVSKALSILKNVIEEEPLIVKQDVNNIVAFKGFGSSSIDFTLYFWFDRSNYWEVQNAVSSRIYSELKKNGIDIPFPQLDLHIIDQPEMKRET